MNPMDTELFLALFIAAIFSFLGGAIASFLGVAAERPVRGESINGRSHCRCGRPLKPWENVPVVGWFIAFNGTKCCGATLPVRYVSTELTLAISYAIFLTPIAWHFLGFAYAPWIVSFIVVPVITTIFVFFYLRSAARKEYGIVSSPQ